LIPQDLTAEKQEDDIVKETEAKKEAPKPKEEKTNAASLLGIGRGRGRGKAAEAKKAEKLPSLNERLPVTLDPTRSLLSLTYILDKKDSDPSEDQQAL
jgi:hypothetical protein